MLQKVRNPHTRKACTLPVGLGTVLYATDAFTIIGSGGGP